MKPLKYFGLFVFAIVNTFITAQNTEGVSIKSSPSAPHGSAMLDVESSTKGILIPRVALVNTSSTSPIAVTPTTGLLVYNTTNTSSLSLSPGFHYWDGVWKRIATGFELWTKIGTSNDIQYSNGTVKVGSAASTATTAFQFEVNSASNSEFTAIFEGKYGHKLTFGSQDYISNEPYCNSLTQIGGPSTGTAALPMRFQQVYPDGDVGLQITSWGKTLGSDYQSSISTGNHNLMILQSKKGLRVEADPIAFWSITASLQCNFNFTTGVFSAPSDSSMKKNILDESSVLTRIKQCRPVTFNWKFDKGKDLPVNHGFIAQEIGKIFPELMIDGVEAKNEKTGLMEKKKGVNYIGFISILLKGIQEQEVRIESLEKRLANVESKMK